MSDDRAPQTIMAASIRLGRVAGIPVGLHYSWLIIATLITFSLANHFRASQPGWGGTTVWGTAVVTALLFFVTLLAHELSHAVVAQRRGLRVRSITLFALGGIARIDSEGNTAKTELLVAIVGPIMSAAIGLGCLAGASALGWTPQGGATGMVGALLGWLGSINLLLAVFNLTPAYPLDGGRVLRGVLWGIYNNLERATRHSSRLGQLIAGFFIFIGVYQFFAGAGAGGLWLAFIGWFLLAAAAAEYAEVAMSESLRGVRVGDVMASDCAAVAPATDLRSLVDDVLLRTGRCVVVQSNGHVLGLVTPHEIRRVDRSRWSDVPVREVMRPLDQVRAVTPDTPTHEALATMVQHDVNQLPVLTGGRLAGIISRGHILQLLQARAELTR